MSKRQRIPGFVTIVIFSKFVDKTQVLRDAKGFQQASKGLSWTYWQGLVRTGEVNNAASGHVFVLLPNKQGAAADVRAGHGCFKA